ncbi:MAG: CopG family transcriptional regulator [Actinomycetes bacterium]
MGKYEGYIDLKKTVIRDSKGRRITDAYIEKSLKETEEYRKQLRAGRPSLTKEGITSPRVTVRLPKKLHNLAKLKAKKKGLSISDLTRIALEKYLKVS